MVAQGVGMQGGERVWNIKGYLGVGVDPCGVGTVVYLDCVSYRKPLM